MSEGQPDRISYSQTVRVNIGDYEHQDVFISYQTDVREKESPQKAFLRAKKLVKVEMKKVEKTIRKKSEPFVDFDTTTKGNI